MRRSISHTSVPDTRTEETTTESHGLDVRQEQAEEFRLRREVRRLEMENEILRGAAVHLPSVSVPK
jgi:transposase-like protein